jgi:hypothetical protein
MGCKIFGLFFKILNFLKPIFHNIKKQIYCSSSRKSDNNWRGWIAGSSRRIVLVVWKIKMKR